MVLVRIATPGDANSILDIYGPYIANTSYTFETEIPAVIAFQERIASYSKSWPWLVCEIDGMIAGYAYAARHRERTAYQWSVESSVYIHDDYQRSGVATALYFALLEILKIQKFCNVYAVINLPNDRSVAFHERLGFEYFATFKNVGYKLGRWKNVGWWQLAINDFEFEPVVPIQFSELDPNKFERVLQLASKRIRNK